MKPLIQIAILFLTIPLFSCKAKQLQSSILFDKVDSLLCTLRSVQFDYELKRLDENELDTASDAGNMWIMYSGKPSKSDKYTGLYLRYAQNYPNDNLLYKQVLTKDSFYLSYLAHTLLVDKGKTESGKFENYYPWYLNALEFRQYTEHLRETVYKEVITDTMYCDTPCTYIKLYLKDEEDNPTQHRTAQFMIRKSDGLPIAFGIAGILQKTIKACRWESLKNVRINEPYQLSPETRTKIIQYIQNIPTQLLIPVAEMKPDNNLPFNKDKLIDVKGRTYELEDFKGKVVVLDFWYRNCFYCLKLTPILSRLSKEYSHNDVVFIGINSRDNHMLADQYFKANDINYINLDDQKQLQIKLKVTGFPTTIILDKTGNICDTEIGFNTGSYNRIKEKIDNALKH